MVRYTRFDSNAHGQGPADMQISPEGWAGNYFNSWNRKATNWKSCPRISSQRSPGTEAMK